LFTSLLQNICSAQILYSSIYPTDVFFTASRMPPCLTLPLATGEASVNITLRTLRGWLRVAMWLYTSLSVAGVIKYRWGPAIVISTFSWDHLLHSKRPL
jgi:hypothetical protein